MWKGKRPKIKHSTLIGDYKEGGYKDVDIEVKIVALKIIWISNFMANDVCFPGLFFIIILNL